MIITIAIIVSFALGGLCLHRSLAVWPTVRASSMGVSLLCFIVAWYLLIGAMPPP